MFLPHFSQLQLIIIIVVLIIGYG